MHAKKARFKRSRQRRDSGLLSFWILCSVGFAYVLHLSVCCCRCLFFFLKTEEKETKEGNDEKKSSSTHEHYHPGMDSYQIANGDSGISKAWKDFTLEEKTEILDITAEEFVQEIRSMTAGSILSLVDASVLAEMIKPVLADQRIMSGLRLDFISAVRFHEKMMIPNDPIIKTIVLVMESHLLLVYNRRLIWDRFRIFVLFWVWTMEGHYWFWRYPLMALFGYLAYSSRPKLTVGHAYVSTALILFCDDRPDAPRKEMTNPTHLSRLSGRADSFLVGLLLLSWADWAPYYRVIAVLALIPFLLLQIETYTSTTDQVSFPFFPACVLLLLLVFIFLSPSFLCFFFLVSFRKPYGTFE
jgi:hypothetical protein